jgi:hypothetical protein
VKGETWIANRQSSIVNGSRILRLICNLAPPKLIADCRLPNATITAKFRYIEGKTTFKIDILHGIEFAQHELSISMLLKNFFHDRFASVI